MAASTEEIRDIVTQVKSALRSLANDERAKEISHTKLYGKHILMAEELVG